MNSVFLKKDSLEFSIFKKISPQVFYLFHTSHAVNSQGRGSSSPGSFPLVFAPCASLGGAGWCFSGTQAPFSLAFFFSWIFPFTHFRKLSQLWECPVCSTWTLILLARILPLTYLLTTVPTMCSATLWTLPVLPWWHLWGIASWTEPIALMSTASPFLWIRMYVAKGATPGFLKGQENIWGLRKVSSHILWKIETFIEEDTRNIVHRTMTPQSPSR